jgi:hypothetical protein
MSRPSSPYVETVLARLAMKMPRLVEELMAEEKYWQPPQPPIDSTIFVPFPLFLAAVTKRLRIVVVLESQLRPSEELGMANAMDICEPKIHVYGNSWRTKKYDVKFGEVERLGGAGRPVRIISGCYKLWLD